MAEVDGDGEVSAGADELVVAASVFKVAVALEVFIQVNAGRLDPGERVRMRPASRTPGPTGLSVFADEAEVSVRDLATMMLTVSDNAAAALAMAAPRPAPPRHRLARCRVPDGKPQISRVRGQSTP